LLGFTRRPGLREIQSRFDLIQYLTNLVEIPNKPEVAGLLIWQIIELDPIEDFPALVRLLTEWRFEIDVLHDYSLRVPQPLGRAMQRWAVQPPSPMEYKIIQYAVLLHEYIRHDRLGNTGSSGFMSMCGIDTVGTEAARFEVDG
jgi:uncharacterized protein Usg